MTPEQKQELQTLLDGMDLDLNEAKKYIYEAEYKRQEITKLLSPKEEETF